MKAKSIFAALLLLVAGLQTAWAQKVLLYKTNSQVVEYEVSELDSIVFVEAEAKLVQQIVLSVTSLALQPNEMCFLTATVLPENAQNKVVVWESSDNRVAEVNQSGRVIANANGTCVITCRATDGSGVMAECQCQVKEKQPDTMEYVDLGLPSGTLWATCNVGASKPEEYGDYFAWGETTTKSTYDWSTYKWCKGDEYTMTKYCTDGDYGFTDNLKELQPADDAATANWGSAWQMPSVNQIDELINSSYTTTEWTQVNGVNGRKITSKINGNSIFLPAAGYRRVTSLSGAGDYGHYWSRLLRDGSVRYACYLSIYSDNISRFNSKRDEGQSVRPVRVSAQLVTSITLSQTSLSLEPGKTQTLTATVLPSNATNKAVTWTSSNTSVATVSTSGMVTAVSNGTCVITCRATDGSGVMAECLVTVGSSGQEDDHDYVDLGLPSGTLWATCNVGASKPEEYGDYFAWGEKTTKSDYSWSTYMHCKGSETTITKYCTLSEDGYNGFTDNLTELQPADDAATASWGINWQMPSLDQIKELLNNCSWQWTQQNGVYGRKVTSKSNGNSIFLPAAGYRDGMSLYSAGSAGSYWSRSLDAISDFACCLNSNKGSINWVVEDRSYGFCVRPVRVSSASPAQLVTSITLSQTSLSIEVGKTQTLTAAVLPSNATNKAVTWTSSNTSVATVSTSGMVTAKAVGTCTITCAATDGSGVKAECQCQVKEKQPDTMEYVDLGLPSGTLWATCNVGASKPEEYGDYFAWGETTPKSTYSWITYFDTDNNGSTFKKYYNNGGLTELQPADDAATANWGSGWRMPSSDQINELINDEYTTSEWTQLNGVYGRKVTSKSNGNSIFLPAAGYRWGDELHYAGSNGYYCSSSLGPYVDGYAYYLDFSSGGWSRRIISRGYGQSVRAVRASGEQPAQFVTSITLSQTSLSLEVGKTQTLTATVLPSNATNKAVTWTSSNTSVATVSTSGMVTANAYGTCTITCAATDGSGVKAECQVTVKKPDTMEYVDLGLPSGTKWATCNVGASKPEEYGDYFAWGETKPKSTYDWSTYKWCKGSETTMTKYCTRSKYGYNGFTDNLTELQPEDDAATANWGSGWQMPSSDQIKELCNSSYTTSEWTQLNGVYGRKVTSKSNGNSIFLPAAGSRWEDRLSSAGSFGYCWSSSLSPDYDNSPYDLRFNSGGWGWYYYAYRSYGFSVRPVHCQ